MSLTFYMDVHVKRGITKGLRRRGIDVLTVQEDGRDEHSDSELLTRATELGRVMVTMDEDFLAEASERQASGENFAGVVYAHQLNVTIGQAVNDLELIAEVGHPEDIANRVAFLPL